MSAIIETLIVCDALESPVCEGTYGDGDQRNMSAKAQRKGYHTWVYSKGKDICYECRVYRKGKDQVIKEMYRKAGEK